MVSLVLWFRDSQKIAFKVLPAGSFHFKGRMREDLLPNPIKQLLVGFSSIGSVGPVPHWLLTEGLLQFFATWASPKDSSHMTAGLHQNEQVGEQETRVNKTEPGVFLYLNLRNDTPLLRDSLLRSLWLVCLLFITVILICTSLMTDDC